MKIKIYLIVALKKEKVRGCVWINSRISKIIGIKQIYATNKLIKHIMIIYMDIHRYTIHYFVILSSFLEKYNVKL